MSLELREFIREILVIAKHKYSIDNN